MKKTPNPKTVKQPTGEAPRVVGRVTPKERDELQALFERKNGLSELVLVLQQNGGLDNNAALYEKLVADMGSTTTKMKRWWNDKSAAYRWESIPGRQWAIDFETGEITLGA